MFGMSKASDFRYYQHVTDILVERLSNELIRLKELAAGFQSISGFTDLCLAIDESVFEIERPTDYFVWY